MQEGKAPPTPHQLEVDQKVAEYQKETDSLFVRPFNSQKWQTN
jgi:hypothetical protein